MNLRKLFIRAASISFSAVLMTSVSYAESLSRTSSGNTKTMAEKFRTESIIFTGPVLAPQTHANFCVDYPEDCRVDATSPSQAPVVLDDERMKQLLKVKNKVDNSIVPNPENPDVLHRWRIAPEDGWCADYAITIRHRLISEYGWPPHALLLAQVKSPKSKDIDHLILVARTDKGDLGMDILTKKRVLPWSEILSKYEIKRVQTPTNPRIWNLAVTRIKVKYSVSPQH